MTKKIEYCLFSIDEVQIFLQSHYNLSGLFGNCFGGPIRAIPERVIWAVWTQKLCSMETTDDQSNEPNILDDQLDELYQDLVPQESIGDVRIEPSFF